MISELIVKLFCYITSLFIYLFFIDSFVDHISTAKVLLFEKQIIFKTYETRPKNNISLYRGKYFETMSKKRPLCAEFLDPPQPIINSVHPLNQVVKISINYLKAKVQIYYQILRKDNYEGY